MHKQNSNWCIDGQEISFWLSAIPTDNLYKTSTLRVDATISQSNDLGNYKDEIELNSLAFYRTQIDALMAEQVQ